ncbi:unnamed protein product [Rhodiola kirilowii]
MKEEMKSLMTNNTWTFVKKPEGKRIVKCKWLLRLKEGMNEGDPPRFKARLVAKGFTQKEGVDYTEICSPAVKFKTIRIMLSLVAVYDLELEQMDVKTAFLHGELDEEIYMDQPVGFLDNRYPEHVCYLNKSLYGLKQSPRLWYIRFDTYVLSLGFIRSEFDTCFYFSDLKNEPVYLLLYVDDILLISKSAAKIVKLKSDLNREFDMKDLGKVRKILGMIIERDRKNCFLKLHQKPYLEKVVNKYGNLDSKMVKIPLAPHFLSSKNQSPKTDSEIVRMESVPYANVIGSLMYAMISTRPDLAYAISLLSRFMSNPGMDHWLALKHIVAYVRSTLDVGLCYSKRKDMLELVGYVDADFGEDRDCRKSITAFYITFGMNCISWKSQMKSIVAMSTTESEYIALSESVKEAMWLRGLLSECKLFHGSPIVFSDSQSALCLARNHVYHERSKHIDIKYHFLRQHVESGTLKLLKVDTSQNPADMDTKIITSFKFKHCLDLLFVG